ncbi:transposable element Tcb2 transposase [Trichonephila clavipes]|nr:transposable element Tcb2 transposase [Trichonephila clavipes]
MQMIQVLCQYACSYTPRWRYNQEEGAIEASANSKIHKRDDYPPIVGRLWLVDAPCCWPGGSFGVCRLEIVSCSGHEKVPTRGKPGPERRGRPRGERFEGSCEANLKSKRPFRALSLTPEHRQLPLQWCQARSMWNVTDWQKVVFSVESRFVLGTDDNRVWVWRHPDERYNYPALFYVTLPAQLVGQRYFDDILRPHVGPFLNGLPGAIYQQDNARPHTARVAQDFLRHFQTLPWLALSHDLSPVEPVWDKLKRQMPSCHSVHDLELAVQDLSAHLPQDNIRCLINSMLDRVAACIAAGGGPTRYGSCPVFVSLHSLYSFNCLVFEIK